MWQHRMLHDPGVCRCLCEGMVRDAYQRWLKLGDPLARVRSDRRSGFPPVDSLPLAAPVTPSRPGWVRASIRGVEALTV